MKFDSHGRLAYDNGCTYTYEETINEHVKEVRTNRIAIDQNVDESGRYRGRTVKYFGTLISDESVEYVSGANGRATNMPEIMKLSDNYILSYEYDGNGNIAEIKKNNELIAKYYYDNLNRLVREDNKNFNESYFIFYDNNGNI